MTGSNVPPACASNTCSVGGTTISAGCYVSVTATKSYTPLLAFTGLKGLGFSFSIPSTGITLSPTFYARSGC